MSGEEGLKCPAVRHLAKTVAKSLFSNGILRNSVYGLCTGQSSAKNTEIGISG